MIRIAISPAACEAIRATMPVGSVAGEPQIDEKGERRTWLKPGVVTPSARPGRAGRELQRVILRLANDENW
jgi:hypothetical protein